MYRDKEQRDFPRTLRNQPTDAEKRLWQFLRAQKLRGHKFRRQAAVGRYVVDFVCFSRKLIVELDGPQHLEPDAAEHDQWRTDWLAARTLGRNSMNNAPREKRKKFQWGKTQVDLRLPCTATTPTSST